MELYDCELKVISNIGSLEGESPQGFLRAQNSKLNCIPNLNL